jgi:hypothetical protein
VPIGYRTKFIQKGDREEKRMAKTKKQRPEGLIKYKKSAIATYRIQAEAWTDVLFHVQNGPAGLEKDGQAAPIH